MTWLQNKVMKGKVLHPLFVFILDDHCTNNLIDVVTKIAHFKYLQAGTHQGFNLVATVSLSQTDYIIFHK
jgi:hypothetical protein